jgi:hypothetical protein
VLVRITSRGIELVSRLRDELQNQIADAMSETSSADADSFMNSYRSLDTAAVR